MIRQLDVLEFSNLRLSSLEVGQFSLSLFISFGIVPNQLFPALNCPIIFVIFRIIGSSATLYFSLKNPFLLLNVLNAVSQFNQIHLCLCRICNRLRPNINANTA